MQMEENSVPVCSLKDIFLSVLEGVSLKFFLEEAANALP